jgi:hypothetical protein
VRRKTKEQRDVMTDEVLQRMERAKEKVRGYLEDVKREPMMKLSKKAKPKKPKSEVQEFDSVS